MICSVCKEDLELSFFNKDKSKKSGYRPNCNLCRRKYRQNNKEAIKKKQQEYWNANKEILKQKNKVYYQNNFKTIAKKKQVYRCANIDRHKNWDKLRYLAKHDFILEQKRNYYIKNRTAILLAKSKSLQIKANPLLSIRRLCSFIYKPLIMIRDSHKCVLCQTKKPLILHHIIPIKQDTTKILDPNNLIILCKSCHLQLAHSGNYKEINMSLLNILTTYVSMLWQ